MPDKKKAEPAKESVVNKSASSPPPSGKTDNKARAEEVAPLHTKETAPPSTFAPPATVKPQWEIKVDGEKFYVAREEEDYAPASGDEEGLPERYGVTRLACLARDPFTLYLYWEIEADDMEKGRASLGLSLPELSLVIRLYELAPDEDTIVGFGDSPVDPALSSLYLAAPKDDCDYLAAIGLRDSGGRFAPLAHSNRVRTPAAKPSDVTDPGWAVSDEVFERLYALSAGAGLGGSSFGLGASGLTGSEERLFSGAVSSYGMAKERGFFFWLECELIVRGQTAPDATVTLQGKEIALGSDGTFTARYPLPDGVIDLPAIATSADKAERREISPTVTRSTRRSVERLSTGGSEKHIG